MKKKLPKKVKKVKAWAFLTSNGDFILDDFDGDNIYFKKPKPRFNPFDYGAKTPKWKPTELTITYHV